MYAGRILILSFLTFATLSASVKVQAAPPSVPSSVSFAGQVINFDTEERYERMDRELIAFSYMHSVSTLMIKRSGKYFPIIEPILARYGLPDDLKYFMVIESNLDPKAVSSVGAAGLWQFTKATAKQYGLEIREGVDERFNIEKETVAACEFFTAAFAKYGDWMTVAASYNAGQNGISTRIKNQHQSCGLDLWLTEETSRYMYRVLAAKLMFENPASFGFNVSERYPYIKPSELVTVKESIPDLVSFAEDHGVSYAQLKAANLWLRGTKLDNKDLKEYVIIIPGISVNP